MSGSDEGGSPGGISWRCRIGLVVFGLLVGGAALAAAELLLRLAGFSADRARYDPFAGFSRTVPMFEPATRADGTAVFRTARARRVRTPQEFLAEKPPNGFRVFVVGASSAAGVPYDARSARRRSTARSIGSGPTLQLETRPGAPVQSPENGTIILTSRRARRARRREHAWSPRRGGLVIWPGSGST